jgi:hypothetical protein
MNADRRRFRGYRKDSLVQLAWLIAFNALKVGLASEAHFHGRRKLPGHLSAFTCGWILSFVSIRGLHSRLVSQNDFDVCLSESLAEVGWRIGVGHQNIERIEGSDLGERIETEL